MPKRLITPEDLFALTFVSDPQISPDGQHVLFCRKTVDAEKNKYTTNLYITDLDGHVSAWTQGQGGAGSGRWSPCGKKIAFISGREDKKGQIFLISASGGEATKLTDLPEGSIRTILWSPNGKYIAFDFRPTSEEWTSKAANERKESGKSVPPRVITDPWFRLDADGYFLGDRHALYVVDTESGETKKLYCEAPIDFFDFDWSPASDELIVSHPVTKRPMFETCKDRLIRVNLDGQSWMLDAPVGMNISTVRWSPDGTKIAFFGNDSDRGWGGDNNWLYVVPAEGGEAQKISGDSDYCLSAGTLTDAGEVPSGGLRWSPDSQALYVIVAKNGEVQLGFVPVNGSAVEVLTAGDHVVGMGNLSKDGERVACLYMDPVHPAEIAIYDLAKHEEKPQVLTSFNANFLDEIKLSRPESIWLESPDGAKVQAWVMYPTEYLAPKRYPAVLEIHGGPHAQYGWTFFHEFQLLAAQGYAVVYSNPRGSKGYGEAHCKAIDGKWGDRDWEDIQTVTRWMQHQPFIHPGQMGVMGGSYGGYMTNWAIGHTTDFAGAITDRCVSNMVSMAGTCDFILTEDLYFPGSPFRDAAALWEMSPLKYLSNAKTPTLIIHSEGDLRCSVEQGDQVFAALSQLGVHVRYVRYPDSSSHGMSRNGPPDLRIHRLKEILAWWEKWLQK